MVSSRRRNLFFIFAALLSLGLLAHVYFFGNPLPGSGPFFDYHAAEGEMPASAFNFSAPRPAWLAPPKMGHKPPLVLRIAFMSHPAESDRRAAIRENVLEGVPPDEVVFVHKFFLGVSGDASLDAAARDEALKYGDIESLTNLTESKDQLSRKRYAAFLWGATLSDEPFDYFMTADTDSFLRLAGLARRLRGIRPDLDPRKDRISWGHMLSHWWHWRAGVNDPEDAEIDARYDGDWYHYPAGIMYLFSAPLVSALYARADKLPHRIKYPCDDVMLGSWVYETGPVVESDVPWYDSTGARAAELLQDQQGNPITTLTTHVVHDAPGAHDPPEHGSNTFPIDWNTVCIHHVNAAEIRGLRRIPLWEDEWVSPSINADLPA